MSLIKNTNYWGMKWIRNADKKVFFKEIELYKLTFVVNKDLENEVLKEMAKTGIYGKVILIDTVCRAVYRQLDLSKIPITIIASELLVVNQFNNLCIEFIS